MVGNRRAGSLRKLPPFLAWMMRHLGFEILACAMVLRQHLTLIPAHLVGVICLETLVLCPPYVLRRLLILQILLAVIQEALGLSDPHRVSAPKAAFNFIRQKASLCVISAVLVDFKLALAMKGAC